ncbi:DUF3299 domain-containing protein [uncultured Hyphomonas sp.]|jgi:hypothetical protein|uniref:DUF3299 domain-containing protein n=1 Tax=uncultured Hyphomonas sp. TaxID=225298 RepID=UPI000C5F9C65|nr:hypothetical protein [Hyphomonadaceae bacterium]MBA27774.1 hypothetical protein [Hyphomonadaceae bacterium]MBL4878442.1 DUF3299 domain-containing protein [Hyphomonas sp.]|tara:strand:+ start:8125 stop:8826 length:702 start_codon:yes stop_codon:yes gene_type:complete
MKQISSLLTAALMTGLLAACGQADVPTDTGTPPPEAEATADAPQVGDKIGESEAERKAKREATIAARAADQARKKAEAEARGVTEIGWEDLMPEGEEERLAQMYQSQMSMLYGGGGVAEGSAADAMVQIGTFNTVKELNGKTIRLPGYTVPFEYGAKAEVAEFLMVPYFGACIHAPPPPPNQTVFVSTDDPILLKDLAQAVWVEGILTTETQESELADAAYTLKLTHIEKYEY